MPRESIAPCFGACLKIVLFLLLLSQWHWWAVPPAAAQSLHCSPCALQELFPFSVPCFSISSWHPHPSSISFCSMGWLKALRDPFLVCGPVNKTVQYFGIFLLGLGGEGGGVECWRFPSWESTGIAAQWTKLRGKLEVPQNSVQIQLHTLTIEGGKIKRVWPCPEALTVYIVQWENQKIITPGGWTLWLGKCVRVKSGLLGFSNPYVVIFF